LWPLFLSLFAPLRLCVLLPASPTTALDLYQHGKGDLADYLLGLGGEDAGARTTYTFDRGLRGDSRFTVA